MANPILAPANTWFSPAGNFIAKESVTGIRFGGKSSLDASYPSWDASQDQDGSIMAYVDGTEIVVASTVGGPSSNGCVTFDSTDTPIEFVDDMLKISNYIPPYSEIIGAVLTLYSGDTMNALLITEDVVIEVDGSYVIADAILIATSEFEGLSPGIWIASQAFSSSDISKGAINFNNSSFV